MTLWYLIYNVVGSLDSTPKDIVWVNLATTSIKKDLESFNFLQLDAIQNNPSVAISV
jgi:hypothetical protein